MFSRCRACKAVCVLGGWMGVSVLGPDVVLALGRDRDKAVESALLTELMLSVKCRILNIE